MSHPDGVSGPISKQHYETENGLGNCIILNILNYILSTHSVGDRVTKADRSGAGSSYRASIDFLI